MVFRQNKRVFSLLLLTALFANLFSPFASAITILNASASSQSITAQAEGRSPASLTDKILICTANGVEWVSLAEFQEQSSASTTGLYECPNCYWHSHSLAHIALPQDFYLSATFYLSSVAYPEITLAARSQIYARGIVVRGPPSNVT